MDVYQDELASCEAELSASAAAEAQSQRLEDNIMRAVLSESRPTSSSSPGPDHPGPTSAPCVAARSVIDAFESNMGQLSMDECVQGSDSYGPQSPGQ